MTTISQMCSYCARADKETKPVATKAHGTIRLCERCANYCRGKGWLKEAA